jgi:hypothetical protein
MDVCKEWMDLSGVGICGHIAEPQMTQSTARTSTQAKQIDGNSRGKLCAHLFPAYLSINGFKQRTDWSQFFIGRMKTPEDTQTIHSNGKTGKDYLHRYEEISWRQSNQSRKEGRHRAQAHKV